MPYKKMKVVCDATCRIPDANVKGRRNRGKSACSVLFLDENDKIIDKFSFYLGEMTPPQAEYNAVINALDKASGFCRKDLEVWTDCEFVVRQLDGSYGIKSDNMKPLYDKIKTLERRFVGVIKYFHHPRTSKLAKIADEQAKEELEKRMG